jgi:hypothetical protein
LYLKKIYVYIVILFKHNNTDYRKIMEEPRIEIKVTFDEIPKDVKVFVYMLCIIWIINCVFDKLYKLRNIEYIQL